MPRPEPPVGGASIPEGSRPARHTDPRALPNFPRSDDGMLPAAIGLGEIEERLLRCDTELENLISEHFEAAEQAAHAEADWKGHLGRILVMLADAGDKESADIREARARRAHQDPQDPSSPTGDDLYRLYKVLAGRETSIDRQIRAVQTRATAMMAVAKGIRGQT